MCFDTQSSLVAWVVAVVIAIYLFYRNQNFDRWNAMFILCFTLIQLAEAGIWWNDPSKPSDTNEWLTMIILLILLAQPLVQSYFGFIYTGSEMLGFLVAVFLLIFGYSLYRTLAAKQGQFYTEIGEKGHLVWNDSNYPDSFIGPSPIGFIYLFGLFIPLLYMGSAGLPLLGVGFATLLYSLFMAGKGEFSSYWCYVAVLYAVVAIFV